MGQLFPPTTMADRYVRLLTREKPFTLDEWRAVMECTVFPGGATPYHAAFKDGSVAIREDGGPWKTTTPEQAA